MRQGQILDVNVPRLKYRPGETVKAFVTYKPFRAAEAIMPVEMELPKDLPQGSYQLVISDADRFVQDEQMTQPFRFTAEKASEVFDVLKDMASVRHNAVYVQADPPAGRRGGGADGHAAAPVVAPPDPDGQRPEQYDAVRQLDDPKSSRPTA